MNSGTPKVPPWIHGHWVRKPERAINKHEASFFLIALSDDALLDFNFRQEFPRGFEV